MGYADLLRRHGPLWLTVDRDVSEGYSVHALVVIGLRGEALDVTLTYIDPDGGVEVSESLADFQRKVEELARGDLSYIGDFRVQIAHFSA